MTSEEMLNFVTWHFEVGSALDTRVRHLGGGAVEWEGRLVGPRFDVSAQLSVRLEGRELFGVAQMKAAPGSHIFDMVLGCRLLCPPGKLIRKSLPDVMHAGAGNYLDLPQDECVVSWGEYGSNFTARCAMKEMSEGFAWVPYIADEPDGWRLHARVRANGGQGFRRFWFFDREVLRSSIPQAEQDVSTEAHAHSPLYRFFRAADYRERTAKDPFTFNACIRVLLPEGIIP